jgi:N-methylhydantoinase B/oxoprolinase/acetone carboxylase alpha subunit
MHPGDVFVIATPGGGGFGLAAEKKTAVAEGRS